MDTFEGVQKCMQDALNILPDRITPDATLGDLCGGGLDSLDMTELINCLDEEFELEIPDTEVSTLNLSVLYGPEITVQQIVNMVDRYKHE